MSLSVWVADDSALIRERLAGIISEIDGAHLVGQAPTGQEAIALASQHKPPVVILDIRMPGDSGIETLQAIQG